MSFSNWTLVTAGLGDLRFSEAANRVARQAKSGGFKNVFVLEAANLSRTCPRLLSRYPNIFSSDTPGYGYWSYKPEVLLNHLTMNSKGSSGVIWVDSGCELNLNIITRIRLRIYMLIARFQGALVFSLKTPEKYYTKRSVLNLFPPFSDSKMEFQIQATWFMLFGKKGEAIAREWLDTILIDLSLFDSNFDLNVEDPQFVAPRNDQSIFSMVCKQAGVRPLIYPPPARAHSKISKVRCFFHPIWVARNRSGQTVVPDFRLLRKFLRAK